MITARLAFDAGPGAGLGHRSRTEAIAVELKRRGLEVFLVPAEDKTRADIVLVDSYRERADQHDHFQGHILAAIDDLERDLAVDVVIDPNPPLNGPRPTHAKIKLLGPRYAPLAELECATAKPFSIVADAVVVTTGASDAVGIGQAVASALIRRGTTMAIRLVIGPWGDQTVPAGAAAVHAPHGLESELSQSDIVVTAGGVTLLEALRLGRPTVALVTATNQRRAVTGAVAAGAAIEAGDPEEAAHLAASLALDPHRRRQLSRAAMSYVDGQGARRIADKLLAAFSEGRSP